MAHYVQNLGDEPLRYLEKPRRSLSRARRRFQSFPGSIDPPALRACVSVAKVVVLRSALSFFAARAASGHAAAPPSSVMNARLFIRSPRRRGRALMDPQSKADEQ